MSHLSDPLFWLSLLQIVWINLLLSGDNAIVIALACRSLPGRQRIWGMVFGAGVATGLRILFTGIAVELMSLPYLRILGGIALTWIAIKLVFPRDTAPDDVGAAESLCKAVRVIAVADVIMSLDNIVAIAGAANGDLALMIFGLGLSIPLVVAGSSIVMSILTYFPRMIWAGAVFLGWIAGQMIFEDVGLSAFRGTVSSHVSYFFAAAGALVVLSVGFFATRANSSS
jgi:YjbE family integral membrane protein